MMELLDQTLQNVFEKIDWFVACGQPLPLHTSFRLASAHSWQEAVTAVSDEEWDAVTLYFRNDLSIFLSHHHRTLFSQTWNKVAFAANDLYATRINDALRKRLENWVDDDSANVICQDVRRTVRGAFHECFYQDLEPSPSTHFFSELVPLLQAGHYPCGWQLPWPNGKLIVY